MVFVISAWFLAAAMGAAQAPENSGAGKTVQKKKEKKGDAVKLGTLEQHIAEALKNNPDIRVAEAKVSEADAELRRTRGKVISELTILLAEITEAQAEVVAAETRLKEKKQLRDSHTISAEQYDAATRILTRAKADLAIKSAKLPYLIGKQADGERLAVARLADLDSRSQFRAVVDQVMENKWKVVPVGSDTSTADKLRKILDAPASLVAPGQSKGQSNAQFVFDHMRKSMLPGINLVVRAKVLDKPVNLPLNQPVPVGAVMQYLEDELKVVFILRDYGIIVISAEEEFPPGAILVIDFWKRGKMAAPGQPKDAEKPNPGVQPNPAKEMKRGAIEKVGPRP
jgi:hypothetical protein